MKIDLRALLFCLLYLFSNSTLAESRVAFEGTPKFRVIATPEGVDEVVLDEKYAKQKRVIIIEKEGKFYWASRENKLMAKTESGSYITYIAVDGTGYVRTSTPWLYELKLKLTPEEQALEVDYLEHLVQMFDTYTFYGDKD